MTFEVDVFISYAHIDNLPLKEGDNGWVANFHKALEIRLAQLIGERPTIWRDQKLQGNDFFGDEIVQQFPKTALMISVLSPRYLKSEWCTREVKEFHKAASNNIGARNGTKSRIFKIIKTAVPIETHPREIADTLGYEFFIDDPNTGKKKELHAKGPNELEQLYWARLDDIAYDIRDLLLQLKESTPTAALNPEEQLTVYLAETTSDLKAQRDMIKRQLIEYGYRILPASPLPVVESQFVEAVTHCLEQSVLSIHLVGSSYGMVPEGSQKSIIVLQNELAAQQSQTGKLHRLIWLLDDGKKDSEKQKQFIQLLRSCPNAQYRADLFETSIEEFKSAIQDKMKLLQASITSPKHSFQSISTVYLAETNHELEEKREHIRKYLVERGCTVLPEQPLPLVHSKLNEMITCLLDRCDVSIHLLGENYGVVPEETEKSILLLQSEQAREKSRSGKLESLIWVSPTIDHTDQRQHLFINTIKENVLTLPHTDMFETPSDEMKMEIFERLEKIEEKRCQAKKAAEAAKEASTNRGQGDEAKQSPWLIYLICDQKDLDDQENSYVVKLEDMLFDSGFEVVLPIFDGKEEDIMQDHHENLRTCDAVIIYYGTGSELWMRSISRDLTKIAGYGRTQPLQAKAVLLGPPGSRPKERFRSHGTLVINSTTGFSPDLLAPFIEKLK